MQHRARISGETYGVIQYKPPWEEDLSRADLITLFDQNYVRFDCEISAPPGRDPS